MFINAFRTQMFRQLSLVISLPRNLIHKNNHTINLTTIYAKSQLTYRS